MYFQFTRLTCEKAGEQFKSVYAEAVILTNKLEK